MTNIYHLIFKTQKAFSLVEVIIAVFILEVGILAVLAIFPLGVQLIRYSKMTAVAGQLAQEKIEEMISKSYIDISSEPEEVLAAPFSAYSRKTDITCFDSNGDSEPNCPAETGIKEIKVSVSWASLFGVTSKKIEISTLISKR